MPMKKVLNKAKATDLIAISNDLINKAQWPRLSINQQRLVLYMLALVEKDDKDFQMYRISIKELANIIGLKHKDPYQQFDQATDGLMGKILKWIEAPFTEDETLCKVAWCSSARLIKGRGYVELSFDPHLKPFLLALKGNFTRYELRSVIRLKNHYSLRIYQFLKYNQGIATRDHRESIIVPLNWLKEYLDANTPGYCNFGPFRRYVLEPTQRDIKKQTDILFEFNPIKVSRRVEHIQFFWKKNPDYHPKLINVDKWIWKEEPSPSSEHLSRTPASEPIESSPPQLEPSHEPVSDEIEKKLQELGFDDWQKIRNRLSDEDWKIAFADLDFEIQRKAKSGQHLANPGGWLRSRIRLSRAGESYKSSKLYQKNRQEAQAKKATADRKEKERQNAARVEHLQKIFDKERDNKLKELISNYTTDQNKAFKAWVDENYPANEFVKPFKENGEPNLIYLKPFLINQFAPQYQDFVQWARNRKGIILQEGPTGYRITEEQQQFF